MTMDLAPVKVDDWTLFAGSEGSHWIRDLDLAERAGLKVPRDIRRTIRAALEDGAMATVDGSSDGKTTGIIGVGATHANKTPEIIGAGSDGANNARGNGPLVCVEKEISVSGKGRTDQVDAYYLNQEAALLLVMRLRTLRAVELTKAVVKVFLAVAQGRIHVAPPPPPPVLGEWSETAIALKRADLIARIASMFSPAVSQEAKDALLANAAVIAGATDRVAPLLPRISDDGWRRPTEIAKDLGVSAQAVGLAITALGLRGDQGAAHRKCVMDKKQNGDGQVPCFLWDREVQKLIADYLEQKKTNKGQTAAAP